MTDISNYLFIDGNYLRRAYEDTMRKFFPDVHHSNLDLTAIKRATNASKAFYYDAVDEQDADAQQRKDYLNSIHRLDGFHVRQGTITGKARKQKRVDVQLAVECLTHAHNKNIWHATLVAGDLDFEPLVSALINAGTHVHVLYERGSAAKDLYQAADVAQEMTIATFWQWSTLSFKRKQPAPTLDNTSYGPGGSPSDIHTIPARGTWNGRPVDLCTRGNPVHYMLFFPHHEDMPSNTWHFDDRTRLETFFLLANGGDLVWQ
jgi:uncharacterized LabA/DUF88 family protein